MSCSDPSGGEREAETPAAPSGPDSPGGDAAPPGVSRPTGTATSLSRNVAANFAGMLVLAISGFVLPRLVCDQIGDQMLGIWDFSWSLVVYTGLLSFGVTSAVSRYVARFRQVEDWLGLSRTVSACMVVLGCSCLVGIGALGVFVVLTPLLLGPTTGEEDVYLAQWLVGILGFNAAIMLPLNVFSGILTGCQRFDLKNLTRCGCHLTGFAVMVGLLSTGHGLIALACVSLSAEVCTGLLDYLIVRRLCPQLRVSLKLVQRTDLREVLRFGGKTLLQAISRNAVYQTSGLIVAYSLGPVVLAVYARQRALVMFATKLMNQYGNVFTPATSGLQAAGDIAGLPRLATIATRYSLYIALPVVLVLTLAGGPIVRLWMGSDYEAPLVLAIFAIGHLPSMASRAAYRILVGLDQHGRAGLSELVWALMSVALGLLLVVVFQMGIRGAAVAVAIPLSIGAGLMPQIHLCRALRLSTVTYAAQVLPGPLAATLPMAVMLLLARFLCGGQTGLELIVGVGGGGVALALVYWRYVLPTALKMRLLSRLGFTRRPEKETRRDLLCAAEEERRADGGARCIDSRTTADER